MTLADRLAADRRGIILRLLTEMEGHALNEDTLARELARLRIGIITRDDLRALLVWLERAGLLTLEHLADAPGGDLWVAAATRQGRDVARGAAWPGVAAPL